ncbi:MAG: cysteine desulfurase [Nitrospinae bacterium]|nr:cysteine desulfurase [Nitrospinota bacterium]MBF0633449.1 cysteine desulfurase [Nitrospinota bacterium]
MSIETGEGNSPAPDPLQDEKFYTDLMNRAAQEALDELAQPFVDAAAPVMPFMDKDELASHLNWDETKPDRCIQKVADGYVDKKLSDMFGEAGGIIPEGFDAATCVKTVASISNASFGMTPSDVANMATSGELEQSFYFLRASEPAVAPAKKPAPNSAFDVEAVRKDFPILQRQVHGKPLIWLDNAATTQKPKCVMDKLVEYYEQDNSNVHRGAHYLAMLATDAYEEARKKVQGFIGSASADEIVFVRGATEAINLVAQTFGRRRVAAGDEIIISQLEHHANIVPWQFLCQEKGATLRVIPISDDGEVLLDEFAKLLNPRTRLVAISHVSNVLGTVVPVSQITAMAHARGVPVLVDGAQGVPHLPVNVREMDADFYAFSGHKLFGPTGIGILYGKMELLNEMPPWQGGGMMIENVTFTKTTFNKPPAKFEAGTGNIADAVGLGAAIDYLNGIDLRAAEKYESGLMSYATSALSAIPGLRQFGTTKDKVGALAFVIPGIATEDIGVFLDKEGIAVRAGHHCAQPTMARYGVSSMVRPSLAFYNTKAEIDALAEAIEKAKVALK